MELFAYKGEACSEFEKEPGNVIDQFFFNSPFMGFLVNCGKLKTYGSLSICCARSDWSGGRVF